MALGGLIAKPHVAEKLKPGTHAATYGGNPIACAAALATIRTIEEENLLERATHIGDYFRRRFEALKERSPVIHEVRVMGAMIGIQLAVDGAPVVKTCMENHLLINVTHQTVVRLLPALNISDAEMAQGADILEAALLAV